jgi:twitching motility two-component system response regulator PilH
MGQYMLSGKILVADDAAFDRARLIAVVKSLGCEAIEVPYADQVVEIAGKEQPSMILMDVIMGPPNGFEVCRTLRENPLTKHIPVVLCSVKSSKVDHDWARRQGAMGYLAKPIDHAKTRDFILRQWDRFQEAVQMSRARDEKQKQLTEAAAGAASTLENIQGQMASVERTPKPSLGWKQVEGARALGSIDPGDDKEGVSSS